MIHREPGYLRLSALAAGAEVFTERVLFLISAVSDVLAAVRLAVSS